METFYKVCVILLIIGGVNWGLVGLFSFDAVGWLLGGSASLLSRIVFTVVGVAAVRHSRPVRRRRKRPDRGRINFFKKFQKSPCIFPNALL